jgi:hypothetical protein
MSIEKEQRDIFANMKLDDDHCFLCGCDMGEEFIVEHVFPKWLGLSSSKINSIWNQYEQAFTFTE